MAPITSVKMAQESYVDRPNKQKKMDAAARKVNIERFLKNGRFFEALIFQNAIK